jgi:hypothetical protein
VIEAVRHWIYGIKRYKIIAGNPEKEGEILRNATQNIRG